LFSLGYQYREFGYAEITYTIGYNFIFVIFYRLLLDKIEECKSIDIDKLDIDSSFELEDLIGDLDDQRVKMFSRLDQYIKYQLKRRGFSIIQISYCGFDTEYDKLNERKNLNFLISAQTAIQRRTLVKFPIYKTFEISYIHPLNSGVSNVFKNKVDLVDGYKYKKHSLNYPWINLERILTKWLYLTTP
jgi:hypothetical protein